MRAIDVLVRQFLQTVDPAKRKVVVNLGCGRYVPPIITNLHRQRAPHRKLTAVSFVSDVLPWRINARHRDDCSHTLFIDVDHPKLMRNKRHTILQTPQLRELLGDDLFTSEARGDPLLLRSRKYCQVACDVSDIATLRQSLDLLVDAEKDAVLLVADMSLVYHDVVTADRLLDMGQGLGQAQFCLLDHVLPAGQNHPYARMMLANYEKKQTPLRSLNKYATVKDQRARFETRGWSHTRVWDLWDVWSQDDFTSSGEREVIMGGEPFDDWEDLILLARHFIVLHASFSDRPSSSSLDATPTAPMGQLDDLEVIHHPQPKSLKRRLGQVLPLSTPEGRRSLVHVMGTNNSGVSETYDIFALEGGGAVLKMPASGPKPRVCFTLTDLGEFGALLVGGRAPNPTKAFSDCWLLVKGAQPSWKPTWELPTRLFRHSAVVLGRSSMVLIVGGHTGSRISRDCFVFHPERGWLTCEVQRALETPVFGAVAWCSSESNSEMPAGTYQGVLVGGMVHDATLSSRTYSWHLDMAQTRVRISKSSLRSEIPVNHVQ